MGDLDGAKVVCNRHAPNTQCLVDVSQATYQQYGVGKATLGAMLSLDVLRESIAVTREFGMGDANGGDVSQMPATFVIAASGRFSLVHYSRTIADYPREQQLIDALRVAL
jgi:hypothetical protein